MQGEICSHCNISSIRKVVKGVFTGTLFFYLNANASRVDVRFTCEPGQATLAISDDGQGFDMGSIPPGHFGVGIMQERAESIGTVLEITSQPGAGTRVMVNWQEQTKE